MGGLPEMVLLKALLLYILLVVKAFLVLEIGGYGLRYILLR